MTKFIAWFSFIVLAIGIAWAFAVYGPEFKTDTENWYQDQIQQNQDQIQQNQDKTEDTENEDTENEETINPEVVARINATGTMFLIK